MVGLKKTLERRLFRQFTWAYGVPWKKSTWIPIS